MKSIKQFLIENGYGCFINEMKLSNYKRMIIKINQKFSREYNLDSIIPECEIMEVI